MSDVITFLRKIKQDETPRQCLTLVLPRYFLYVTFVIKAGVTMAPSREFVIQHPYTYMRYPGLAMDFL